MEEFRNVIVIGASAGGFIAIKQLISKLPETIDASVFLVIHLSDASNSKDLINIFQKSTSLICQVPFEKTKIKKGHLYIAPANYHLMLQNNFVNINHGPRENRYRPSIDVLFRSAAVYYSNRVIGIILTGMLDDGTSGMSAIKRCGGICIVQDPADAEFSDMPKNVINRIEVDYKIPLKEIPHVLEEIFTKPPPEKVNIPHELKVEVKLIEKMMTSINEINEIADRTDYVCPECGGGLWAIKNDPVHRYRCHTGHVYTENVLYDIKGTALEESVWVSMRILEERRNMLNIMAEHDEQSGHLTLASESKNRVFEMEKHIESLKLILSKLAENRLNNQ